jgi:tripartite ATP-independent transporter DctM subunit
MNVQGAAGASGTGTARNLPALIRFADGATSFSGFLSALGLLGMTSIVCFEIFSRYIFNAPTSWITEVATYDLVAVAFLGLAAAQRAGAHIQVELLLNSLSARARVELLLVANWIGLFFVLFCAWQVASFSYGEYVNGTRDWGLLSTPQWIPQVPLTIGFALFAWALLADSFRLRAPEGGTPFRIAQVGLAGLAITLLLLGRFPVAISGTSADWGSLAICAAFFAIVFSWSGWRTGLAVLGLLAGLGVVFWFARGASLPVLGALLAAAILVFLLLGVRVAMALGLVGMFGLYFLLPKPQLSVLAERAWSSVNSFTLTAIPMFVMMSSLLLRSGVTTRMFDSLVRWFGRTPGGLAHASVGASAIFAAVSGSSLATAATLGKVACPEMVARGYSPRLTYGVTAAGATLGIMIPPSIAMIIYGSTVGAPINLLFIAGIVPGLTMAAGFMVVALVWSMAVPGAAPKGDRYTTGEKLRSLTNMIPFAVVILSVLGSLYAGIATPTEAAALGALMALVLCVVYRRFSWRMLYETAIETVGVTAFILLIVVCAAAVSWVFDYLRLPRALVELIRNANVAPWLVITLISIIYVVLGMFVESISMILMTLPVTYPVVMALGFDPIWFGIYLVVMVEIGLITPPVGMVLFVLRGMSGDVPLKEIAYGALPFIGINLAFVALIFVFPEIVAWLPDKIK